MCPTDIFDDACVTILDSSPVSLDDLEKHLSVGKALGLDKAFNATLSQSDRSSPDSTSPSTFFLFALAIIPA